MTINVIFRLDIHRNETCMMGYNSPSENAVQSLCDVHVKVLFPRHRCSILTGLVLT